MMKTIEGYPDYSICDDGTVHSFKGMVPKIRKNTLCKNNGYFMLRLTKRGYSTSKNMTLHRLLAKAFIPNPENKPYINHKNGIKTDNRLANLEWVTASENIIHRYKDLGKKCRMRAENQDNINMVKFLISRGLENFEIEKITGIKRQVVSEVKRGYTYRDTEYADWLKSWYRGAGHH
jgi:hypothetical protein